MLILEALHVPLDKEKVVYVFSVSTPIPNTVIVVQINMYI